MLQVNITPLLDFFRLNTYIRLCCTPQRVQLANISVLLAILAILEKQSTTESHEIRRCTDIAVYLRLDNSLI